MTSHPLSELIEQLRNTNFVFPLLEQHRFGTIYMMPYTVQENEQHSFAANLEEQLSFTTLINDTRHKLEHEIAPYNKRMAEYTGNLYKIFSGYSKEGPYSIRYFNRILSSLNTLQRIAELYSQRDQELIIQLQSLLSVAHTHEPIGSNDEYIETCANYRARYIRELQKFYDVFNDFLQRESDKKQGAQVTTRTEQYLANLTGMINQSIYLSRSMRKMLGKLKDRMLLAQNQIQYN